MAIPGGTWSTWAPLPGLISDANGQTSAHAKDEEQTIYVSDDGERFDKAEDCQLWERLADKVEAVNQVCLCGAREEGDDLEGFPPLEAQRFLDIRPFEEDLGKTLGDELFGYKCSSANFLEIAKDVKAFSDWLWS